jgi:hypothetical protein
MTGNPVRFDQAGKEGGPRRPSDAVHGGSCTERDTDRSARSKMIGGVVAGRSSSRSRLSALMRVENPGAVNETVNHSTS